MERYKVKIYPSAQQDLRDIVDYLNTLSPSAALRYYDKLTEEIAVNCQPVNHAGAVSETAGPGFGGKRLPVSDRGKLSDFLCRIRRHGADTAHPIRPQRLPRAALK